MKKRIEVASTDSRKFVQALLELGAQGATLPSDCGVFKGIMLRTKVEVAEDVAVVESPVIRVLPQEKEKAVAKAVINTQVEKAPKQETKQETKAKRGPKKAVEAEAPVVDEADKAPQEDSKTDTEE